MKDIPHPPVCDMGVQIGGLRLANPIMPASGTFSEDLSDVFDLDILGAHVLKTIMRDARAGNPTPRVCDLQGGMLNAIGIPSKGIDDFRDRMLPYWAGYKAPLIVSISAHTVDEFAQLCREVTLPGVAAIEANISCPNIEADGRAFAMRPDTTEQVVQRLRAETDLPLWAKLTPNTGEPVDVALAAEAAGADALVVANTALGMSIDVTTRQPRLGNIMGGISGPAIKPIALRMTYQIARACRIPVIGCGGIATRDDALEFMIAGARAVQVGTATFQSPTVMARLVAELSEWASAEGLTSIEEIIGSVGTPRGDMS
ncbi:dihydroorotate dehydrogenase [Pseudooceanicola sediminis]|uniref:Dihydroorotate dehydrogenase n=1 Tax=Pseudooceanicola sediminis TaxID=2211117 RepID=A0A399IYG5_9RHOB|nr:dihydroorotate dehydrogenase [Pseudooceanicola sediminis]KAA2312107.1 dihydroorotate dehydrogenase [Puniceibacterium sp. HSS470]RII38115.1 dihydroorotate dehydrogenase [Pseudooceanicola sediminis]|tara:strand:- start:2535 stop:3479 length:945 start_codon:yes stop_codon:yes gene_type:complete